jgi:hypothetical protein
MIEAEMECLIKYMEERKLPTGLRQRIRQYSSLLLNGLTPGASPPKGTGPTPRTSAPGLAVHRISQYAAPHDLL